MTETLEATGAIATKTQRPYGPPDSVVLVSRLVTGVVSVFVISIVVYAATLVLPGDAATAILGQQATPQTARRVARTSCTWISLRSADI